MPPTFAGAGFALTVDACLPLELCLPLDEVLILSLPPEVGWIV